MPAPLKQHAHRVASLNILVLLVLSLLFAGTALASKDDRPQVSQVDQLRAFTKVYGYARFFHPSDEAAEADWEKLAIDGAARILEMKKNESLDQVLLEIFRPVAPTIQIVDADDDDAELPLFDLPSSGGDVVAWQHSGVGVLNDGTYMSVRSNRDNYYGATYVSEITSLTQKIDPSELRGKEIRLSFAARLETPRSVGFPLGWGSGSFYAYLEDGDLGFYESMRGREIIDPEWRRYEIVGIVDEDAAEITLGVTFYFAGSLWLDAFECEVRNPDGIWESVELVNPGFEDVFPPLNGWDHPDGTFRFAVDVNEPFEGEGSALIANEATPCPDRLFEEMLALGEVIDKEIGCDLKVILPLAVPVETTEASASDGGGPGDDDTDSSVAATRIAAVAVGWNLFQHFYTYFDVLDIDWDEELTIALTGALEAQSDHEFFRVLEKLVAGLKDGHINLTGPDPDRNNATLPIRVDWIENQVVVTRSITPEVLPGDVVVEMDGTPAEEILEEAEQYVSASPQRTRYVGVWLFVRGMNHTEAVLTVRRDGEEFQVTLQRTLLYVPTIPRPDSISEISDGIYYVDLSRSPLSEINQVIDELASATGVIFDLRGYPMTLAEAVISHMIDDQVLSAIWNVPLALYPDRENLEWDTSGRWHISPQEPRIQGKIVFMTDVRAISYGESVMGIIEGYELAEIVGRPTAGANGNVNVLHLPGGFLSAWTGMKVLKHDGSQHHLIGILPTVPVELTIEGVRDGRDEDLEKAMEIIQGG